MKPTAWRDEIVASDLDRCAKLVAHTISAYMNGGGDTFVGKPLIADGAGLNSVRSVDEAINRLELSGYLIVVRSRGGRPNHYLASTPQQGAGSTPHGGAGKKRRNPANESTQPRKRRHQTPHWGAPEVAESDESGDTTRASLDESASSVAITDSCVKCGTEFETTAENGDAFCPPCRATENGAAPAEELIEQ